MGQKLQTTSAQVAGTLLDIGGVIMAPDKPFVWASGLLAPLYCDNRLIISYPEARTRVVDAFVEELADVEIDAVVGVPTAGLAYAAWVADRLGLPMAYARSKPKGHGRRNQVEGHLEPGSRVVIIEDLVATGESSLVVADAVRKVTGVVPVQVMAIVAYGLKGVKDLYAAQGMELKTLTTFDTLLQVGLERRLIKASDAVNLREWQQDVHAWSAKVKEQAGEPS